MLQINIYFVTKHTQHYNIISQTCCELFQVNNRPYQFKNYQQNLLITKMHVISFFHKKIYRCLQKMTNVYI